MQYLGTFKSTMYGDSFVCGDVELQIADDGKSGLVTIIYRGVFRHGVQMTVPLKEKEDGKIIEGSLNEQIMRFHSLVKTADRITGSYDTINPLDTGVFNVERVAYCIHINDNKATLADINQST